MKTSYAVMLCAAFAALNVSAKTSTPDGWLDDWSVVQDLSHWWLIWDGISGTNRKELQRLHAL